MLVYDMHGDYLSLFKQNLFYNNKIKLFYPSLSVKAEDKEIIYTLINKLGKPLIEPQNDYLNTLLNKVKFDESSIIKFLNLISSLKGLELKISLWLKFNATYKTCNNVCCK